MALPFSFSRLLSLITTTLTAASCLVPLQASAESYNMVTGLWEITTTTEFKGLPDNVARMMNRPDYTYQECITDPEQAFKKDDECHYERKRINRDLMKIVMTCENPMGEDSNKGVGEIHFKGKTADGTFRVEMLSPSGPIDMSSTFTARYIGHCS